MKVKKPKSNDAPTKSEKLVGSKTLKKKVKKNKSLANVPNNVSVKNKDDTMKKQKAKEKTPEQAAEWSQKKAKKLKQKITDKPDGSPNSNQTPNDNKKRKPIRKKRSFNKDAIEKMKAHQLAKKEKLMRHSAPASPPKPDAKRRRPKLPVRLESVDLKFSEDDETMTQFEDMWVPREETGRLQSAREDLEKRGLPIERVNQRMKKLVRREHRKLKLRLIAAQTKTERVARERRQILEQTPRVRRRVPGRACGLKLQESEQLARFDGFWVAAEAAPRLEALRQKLADEGKSENEARRLLRKIRRVEERKVKSSGRLLCTKCGGRGHLMSDCTAQAVQAAAGTACFRCGQAGHRLSDCPKKGQIAGLPFATCFLCKQQGHMSRECPQAEADAGQQKPGKTTSGGGGGGGRTGGGGGGGSWRGLTHDADETVVEPAVKKTPPPPAGKSKQKDKAHVRFD